MGLLKMDLTGELPADLTIKLVPGGAFACRLTAIAPQVFPAGSEVVLRFGDPRELDVDDIVEWSATVTPEYAQFMVDEADVLDLIKDANIVEGDSFYCMLIYRMLDLNIDLVWAHTSNGEVDW
jgi:hypothetical protein